MKASFFINKNILEKNLIKQNYYIIFIYQSYCFPTFKNVNDSIINIFNKVNKIIVEIIDLH
ncbi:hypothetical protein [Blattabacterium cuenoti]|uniref:hypothetical protein n=1 Tax=Blattabacterium cuenoti TaxID=1653831 RepID=UPI00374D4444